MIHHTHQRSKVDDETQGRKWGISTAFAGRTKNVTTQRGLWYLEGNLDRRFKTWLTQLHRPLLYTNVYADTMFSSTALVRGNTCAEIFVTTERLVNGNVTKTKGKAYLALEKFCKEDGIPNLLVTDRAKEEMHGEWGRIIKRNLITQRTTETESGWQNRVEGEIKKFKKHQQRIKRINQCPDASWCFLWE